MKRSGKVRKKQKLGQFPYLSIMFSVTVALLIIGFFGWIIIHTSVLSKRIKENVQVMVYLDNDISRVDVSKIQTIILSQPYVETSNRPIEFVSKEAAAKDFIASTGEDFNVFLESNPLKDLYIFRLKSAYISKDSLMIIKKELSEVSGVFEVEYDESLISSIGSNIKKIEIILITIGVFMIFVVIIIINNTIKLALYSQRLIIRSMQMVGASNSFIKNPFLLKSMLYGLLGGIFTSLIIHVFTDYMNSLVEGLSELQSSEIFLVLYGTIMILGVIVSYFSANRSLNKYLNMSLDELY